MEKHGRKEQTNFHDTQFMSMDISQIYGFVRTNYDTTPVVLGHFLFSVPTKGWAHWMWAKAMPSEEQLVCQSVQSPFSSYAGANVNDCVGGLVPLYG